MIRNLKILFWQCGTVDGVIVRLTITLCVGAILIAASCISIVLHAAAWPFDWTRQLSTQIIRELTRARQE